MPADAPVTRAVCPSPLRVTACSLVCAPIIRRGEREGVTVPSMVTVLRASTVLRRESGSGRRTALRWRTQSPFASSVSWLAVPAFSRGQAILIGSLRTASRRSTVNARETSPRMTRGTVSRRRALSRLATSEAHTAQAGLHNATGVHFQMGAYVDQRWRKGAGAAWCSDGRTARRSEAIPRGFPPFDVAQAC